MSRLLVLSAMAAALAGPAVAQSMATATTDLNLRAGPGPQYQIQGVIPASEAVTVEGCLAAASWCRVDHNGVQGWASADYLTAMIDSQPVVLAMEPARKTVTVIEDNQAQREASAATVGGFGAVTGALIAGPAGAAVGALAGAAAGGSAAPDDQIRTYVVENPVDPVFLEGEVVVGAGIPDTVQLTPIPDSRYSYLYLNGQPVIVENEGRVVSYIVR